MRIIGGKYRNRKLNCPKGQSVRPSAGMLRETLFNICQAYVEGTKFLDLFAGSGAVGIEALSRGASVATFVEVDREALKHLKGNLEQLEIEECKVMGQGVMKALQRLDRLGASFDIIFMDPPYHKPTDTGDSLSSQVLKFLDGSSLLHPETIVFAEDSLKGSVEDLDLKRLELVNSRKMGRSSLRQYKVGS